MDMILKQPSVFRSDKRKDGWQLLENREIEGEPPVYPDTLLREGEESINGEEMLSRAKDLGDCAGQLHAERMLDQQELIPEEWQKYYLVFPATVWVSPDGDRCVPCLDRGGGWHLRFHWLGRDFWLASVRLVRLRK